MIQQAPHRDFVLLAGEWCRDQSAILLGFVWQAYDQMRIDGPSINENDLERSITQLLEPRIYRAMSGYEPFYVLHEPKERERRKRPPGQPPEYDLAFVLWADEEIMWPLEAKVLETAGTVAQYVHSVLDEFVACRYAPFSSEGAMLGYLLSGTPASAFDNIAKGIPCNLDNHQEFSGRPHKRSHHIRTVPAGKPYPSTFRCHHLILEFPGLSRPAGRPARKKKSKKRGRHTQN